MLLPDLVLSWGNLLSVLLAVALPAALLPAMWRRRGSRLRPGTHVLITGGSKGLGLALALQCVERGCSVTIIARKQADLDAALQQLTTAAQAAAAKAAQRSSAAAAIASPSKVQALSADTTDHEQVGGDCLSFPCLSFCLGSC
jgi:NADPH:quinone reductase-like Zn-dependent oxidoreductase